MSVNTLSHFTSAVASGADWREAARNTLQKLEKNTLADRSCNFGFLYISDYLADDATSILNLFRSVLNIENWVGAVGGGVIGTETSYFDVPCISALIGHIPSGSFHIFNQENTALIFNTPDTQNWLQNHIPMLSLIHGNSDLPVDISEALENLERHSNAFLIGGLSSSRTKNLHIANDIHHNALSGVLFSHELPMASTLSQACEPISDFYTITKADDNTILQLDQKKALSLMQEALRGMAAQKLNKNLDTLTAEISHFQSSDHIPHEYQNLFKGQIHVGLSVPVSDRKDFMVRNIIGINPDEGSITVAHDISVGDRVLFAQREPESLEVDLTRTLVAFRERITHERGCFEPKAAIYISCTARVLNSPDTAKPHGNEKELNLIREIIGDIPLTGFYAAGEISNARLYAYTGVLMLFF